MPTAIQKKFGNYTLLVCGSCGRQYYTRQTGIDLQAWFDRVHPDCSPPAIRRSRVSLGQKLANFAASAAKHLAAGMPQATDEQVAARFAICQACEHFDGAACRQCGCPVVREKKFLSKLSWAGESCPVGKWGPVTS
jgi:hypothetical protein